MIDSLDGLHPHGDAIARGAETAARLHNQRGAGRRIARSAASPRDPAS